MCLTYGEVEIKSLKIDSELPAIPAFTQMFYVACGCFRQ